MSVVPMVSCINNGTSSVDPSVNQPSIVHDPSSRKKGNNQPSILHHSHPFRRFHYVRTLSRIRTIGLSILWFAITTAFALLAIGRWSDGKRLGVEGRDLGLRFVGFGFRFCWGLLE